MAVAGGQRSERFGCLIASGRREIVTLGIKTAGRGWLVPVGQIVTDLYKDEIIANSPFSG